MDFRGHNGIPIFSVHKMEVDLHRIPLKGELRQEFHFHGMGLGHPHRLPEEGIVSPVPHIPGIGPYRVVTLRKPVVKVEIAGIYPHGVLTDLNLVG
ncbi:hypothetical protein SDC9_206394 [bioreactor metagenome]|uniref:Uncharacterized protein n=1 Tax=bioreactor metagenome TaxID=1076179 RepID=A0A645JGG8_9ZZZZ